MNEAQGLTIFLKHLLLFLEDAAVLTSSEIDEAISKATEEIRLKEGIEEALAALSVLLELFPK
jgi:hypothetical protein